MNKTLFFAAAFCAAALLSCWSQSKTAMAPANSVYTADDLVWHDEFDGDSLNENDWNFELHEPGWVNSELQRYVKSRDNIYVKDGRLVIQALKNGKAYTSGRVNTCGKRDFLYGRFEASLKVPKGQGFLPAFWMMPTNEGKYGQWPKCGEIDIMEVLGNQTDTQYSTLHFGEPHTQRQKSLVVSGKDFSQDFHVFACEWDPGEFRFYVDGELFYAESDWFSKAAGKERPYPAPYNQKFYVIFNLAVGGTWPGNPDDSTKFDKNARLEVDYVRVYQKKSYDANVSRPVKSLNMRSPDKDGNYVLNPKFQDKENLSDDKGWAFFLAGNGKGSAEISGGQLIVRPQNFGDLEYSLQVVQSGIPLKKGRKYQFKFDARADAKRTILAAVSAPNLNWIRYFPDTKIQLSEKAKTFQFVFEMKEDSDDMARIEFNLGNQNSKAAVYISNVSLSEY